eukprot:5662466-Pyramimonas_sp.AAC.1
MAGRSALAALPRSGFSVPPGDVPFTCDLAASFILDMKYHPQPGRYGHLSFISVNETLRAHPLV